MQFSWRRTNMTGPYEHCHVPRDGVPADWKRNYYGVLFRLRNASTVLSNASLASIIAQCPQLGNT
jgi:hypothetical protein